MAYIQPAFPRMLSRGRAFVYVVACRDDNLFKIGFSRDPLTRWRNLHPRFFDFFSLDRGILVSTSRVSEARRLERQLLDAFFDHQALAPVTSRPSAGGQTEWFRGAMDDAVDLAKAVASSNAWEWQLPGDCIRAALLERVDLLFSWTAAMLDAIEFETHNEGVESAETGAFHERALLDAMDVFHAMNLDIRGYVPDRVWHWYMERKRLRSRLA